MKATKLMDEVILYGGLPVTRAEAYRHALEVTGDRRAADRFAFGPDTIRLREPNQVECRDL